MKYVDKLFTVIATALFFFVTSPAQSATPVSPGGSNYAWYKIDTGNISTGRNCRENYGIIKNYQKPGVRDIVVNQLQIMRSNGQDRLRIPIFHRSNGSTGTVLQSSGGNLGAYDRESLTRFLSDIKNIGFREILVGFFPVAENDPNYWSSWNDSLYKENWLLIYRTRNIIKSAGIKYRIDLRNEGAPASNQTQAIRYTRRLWNNYNRAFGKSDTVGFSLATGSRNTNDTTLAVNRYNTTKNIYDSSPYGAPYLWDFHFYENLKGRFEALDQAMNIRGDRSSVVIGETFYNDNTTRNEIRSISTSRKIWHVYQWPRTRNKGCDGHVDISFPEYYRY